MADYGLAVLNLNNEVQIDSEFRNIALRASGSLQLTSRISGYSWQVYGASMTLSAGQTGLLAFRCEYPAVIYGAAINGDDVTYWFRAHTNENPNATLYWYLFDEIAKCPPSVGDYGIIVRDGSWSTTYDSRQRYARFIDAFQTTDEHSAVYPGAQTAILQGTVPSLILSLPYIPPPTPRWEYVYMHGFFRAWGNQVTTSRYGYKFNEGPDLLQWPGGNTQYYFGTVLDVTGL